MKKILTAICTTLVAVLLAFGIAGCSSADRVKKAYEDAGYTVKVATLKDNAEAKSALKLIGLTDEQLADGENWEIITATKSVLDSALILKFPSSGDLKDAFTIEKDDGTKDTSIYDNAVDKGNVNGECYYILGSGSAKDVFKNA